jgi:hypothetical protein
MEFIEVATTTADDRFRYDDIIVPSKGKPKRLIDLSGEMNAFLEKENAKEPGWHRNNQWPPVTNLGPGRWGTDINVSRIGRALQLPKDSSIDEIAEAIHAGWVDCFNYWYNHQPWKWVNHNGCKLYFQPGKDMSSRAKLERSKLKFVELDDYQKKIYRQMATFVKTECM